MIYGVVLAGGKGERFWPLSRSDRPKQFLKLTSDKMMLIETIERVLPLIPYKNIRIVTGESMTPFIIEHIKELDRSSILDEPVGKNTCIAIGLAAVHLLKKEPKAVMVVLSADHLIKPAEKLLDILKAGASIAASEEKLITIGIVPTRPETAYGYIKLGDVYKQQNGSVFYHVAAFTEKPKAAVAHEYYYSHQYLWNSGMFIWSAQAVLNAIKNCMPELSRLLETYALQIGTAAEQEARRELYQMATNISIDFAVLEKASNVLTIKADIIWDDIGSWTALSRYKHVDSDNNVLVGDTLMIDSYETTVYNESEGIVTCLGVSDLVVVRTDNITLVIHKTMADRVKEILAKLDENENWHKYL